MPKLRNKSDRAQVEAHRDELLKHYLATGHSKAWLRVLTGEQPGIILPTGDVDQNELAKCRSTIGKYFAIKAPEAVFNEDLASWLSDSQLADLAAGKPAILTHVVERQLAPAVPRSNTSLVSRYRDSAEFGVAQALFYIGLLTKSSANAANTDEAGAVLWAAGELVKQWLPKSIRMKKSGSYKYLLHMHKEGKRDELRSQYLDPRAAKVQVLDYVALAHRSESSRVAELRFWRTVLFGILRTVDHPAQQASSQSLLSRALRGLARFSRTEWLTYRGDLRGPVGVDELVALAYLGLPDIERMFPIHAASAPRFKVAAALGELSRGRMARLDIADLMIIAELMNTNTEHPAAASAATTNASPIPMSADEFLQHSVRRAGDEAWWQGALALPLDGNSALHLSKQVAYRYSNGGQSIDHKGFNAVELEFASADLRRILCQFAANEGYTVIDRPLDGQNLSGILPIGTEMAAILDVVGHRRFGDEQGDRLLESLVQLAAGSTRAFLGLENAQAEYPLRPGYWREKVRANVATQVVLGTRIPKCKERLNCDLSLYARYLTDHEFGVCAARGELTGSIIAEYIKKNSGKTDRHLENTTA